MESDRSTVALNLAFLVNAAILVLAATTFFKNGETGVAEIKEAHRLLKGFLGSDLAPKLFAIALIAAGQSSTVTGTLAGQIVMEGYLRLQDQSTGAPADYKIARYCSCNHRHLYLW